MSSILNPINFLLTPLVFCFSNNLLDVNSLFVFVIHDNPASIGDVSSLISLPYKQKPISSLNVSLAAKPVALISYCLPESNILSHKSLANSFLQYISNPPQPVYPVFEIIIPSIYSK